MQPFIALFRAIAIGEAGPVLVADEEQVSEHIHALALLSVAEKRAHRQFQVLSKQVKQRAFNGRSRVNCHPLVKCLQTSSLGIAISKLTQYTLDDPVMVGDVGVQDEFRHCSSTSRMRSPPGTSPAPVCPALSLSKRILRMK